MFSNQFAGVVKTVCAAANMISLVCPHDYGHPVLTDTRVSNHYDPTWLCTRAICGALFHGLGSFTKSLRAPASLNLRF
jgi:hypothetical protein